MVTHCSSLAWRIPWTEEPGGLLRGVARSWTQLSNYTQETYTLPPNGALESPPSWPEVRRKQPLSHTEEAGETSYLRCILQTIPLPPAQAPAFPGPNTPL